MKPGDTVLITTKEDSFEGILMPRPDMLKKGVTVIKLENGYNIGIDEAKIVSSKVVSKNTTIQKEAPEIKENKKLPTVSIVSFGGTISSKIDYSSGGVKADYDARDFVAMCPELKSIANIKAKRAMQIMSEDVDLDTISQMAEHLKPFLEDDSIKGIVVTVGTDCLHYISSALTFMLPILPKPIIITAAQRSIDRGSSDAFMNLSCSVKAASSWDYGAIAVCMHAHSDDDYCNLLPSAKVRKMHTSRRDAFRPINDTPYATISYPELEILDLKRAKAKDTLVCESKLSEKVGLIHVHPGIKGDIIDYYVSKKYKALVLAATALGHVPTDGASNLLPALEKARAAGVTIIIATQTLYGSTHPFVYANLRKLSIGLDCYFAKDMLPEVAYMKAAWLLGNKKPLADIEKNLVGEINENISEEHFLN